MLRRRLGSEGYPRAAWGTIPRSSRVVCSHFTLGQRHKLGNRDFTQHQRTMGGGELEERIDYQRGAGGIQFVSAAASRWRAHFGWDTPEGGRRVCSATGALLTVGLDRSAHPVAIGGCSAGHRPKRGFTLSRHFDKRYSGCHISCYWQSLVNLNCPPATLQKTPRRRGQ